MIATYAQVVAAKESAEEECRKLKGQIEFLQKDLTQARFDIDYLKEHLRNETEGHTQLRFEHNAMKVRVRAALTE